MVEAVGEAEPDHRPLVAEGAGDDLPALVQRTDEVLGRHLDVVEEHLVEVDVVRGDDRAERPPGEAGHVGGHQHAADALVLGGVGVGAHEGEDHVGVVGAGGPHLLAVDDDAVAVDHAPGAQAAEVGAGVGLAHAEGGGDLGPQDRHRPPLLLLLGAEVEDRRDDDAEALGVEGLLDLAAHQLLEVDELLHHRGVAPAVLGRVAGHQPAGVEHLALPRARPRRDVGARPGPLAGGGGVGERWPRARSASSWRKASVSSSNESFIGRPPRVRARQGSPGPRGPGARCRCRAGARRPWPAGRRAAGRSPR